MKYSALITLIIFTALTTLAGDKKVSDLNYLGHASFASDDLLLIVDTSAVETKNTKISDFDFRYFTKGTDVLALDSGGTGQTSASAAINVLVPTQTSNSGKFLTTNATAVSWASALTAVTGTSPIVSSGGTTPAISCNVASGSQPGCLASADWTTFNSKQSALTFGSITSSTTGVSIGSGSSSTVGPSVTVNVQTASGSQPGLLSAANWTTFNGKQNVYTTQAIASTAIDWSTGVVFKKTLSANTTFTFSNQTSAQIISVIIINTASNYTVTWPSMLWTGGSPPTQTIGAKSDVCTFIYDGTDTRGSCVQDFH